MTERSAEGEPGSSSTSGVIGSPHAPTAAGNATSSLLTVEYLEERARRGDRARFDAVLDKVRARNAPPEPGDEV